MEWDREIYHENSPGPQCPLARNGNDGTPVSAEELNAILKRFGDAFEAYSVEGPFDGFWKGYQDRCLNLIVACDNERLAEAESLVVEVGRELGQKGMYFEIEFFDGVRILPIE